MRTIIGETPVIRKIIRPIDMVTNQRLQQALTLVIPIPQSKKAIFKIASAEEKAT